MLSNAVIDRQVKEARQQLLGWWHDITEGELSPMAPTAIRFLADVLTCLLDEVPDDRKEEINYLIDRCEALSSRVSN